MEDELKNDLKSDIMHSRISVIAHTILAFAMGYISNFLHLGLAISNWIIVPIGFAVLIAFGFIVERMVGKRGFKWWAGNGMLIYLFFWAVAWTLFFNLGV